jgi:hypothetical protein
LTLSIRPGSLVDVDTFTDLVNEHHETFTGEPLWSVEEMRAILVTEVRTRAGSSGQWE